MEKPFLRRMLDAIYPATFLAAPQTALTVPGEATPEQRRVAEFPYRMPTGSAGTAVYSGFFSEEYLSEVQGYKGAEVYDRMRRGDARIKMILNAMKNPIKAAVWSMQAASDDPQHQKQCDLIKHILFDDMGRPWVQTLGEILTVIEFGHAVFETTHKVVFDHPRFGTYNGVQAFGWRSPKTFLNWNLDPLTGKLLSVKQMVNGDLSRHVDLPGEFLTVFTLELEGSNYEGISMLRACYGPWFRKNTFLKLQAIGVEKSAVPTPQVTFPNGVQDSEQFDAMVEVLEDYVGHHKNYLMIPEGWALEFLDTKFDPQKVKEQLLFENQEMVDAFNAQFLALGQGASGSYAMSFDLSDFFLGGLEAIAQLICDTLNFKFIPDLVRLNFGEQEAYPKLIHSGISDKAGKELAEIIKILREADVLIPDDKLEAIVRERYNFPIASDEGKRLKAPTAAPVDEDGDKSEGGGGDLPDGGGDGGKKALPKGEEKEEPEEKKEPEEDDKKFAEVRYLSEAKATIKMLIKGGGGTLEQVMRDNLQVLSRAFVGDIMRAYRKATPAQQANLRKTTGSPKGRPAYVQALLAELGRISEVSLDAVRKEVPRKKAVKLSEGRIPEVILLAEFEELPLDLQRRLKARAELLADTQLADLEKATYFQLESSRGSTDSDSLLEKDLLDSADKYLDSASVRVGAADTAAFIVNETRNAFFFDEEVLSDIESFTFVNGDPVTDICKDLNGKTFRADDPEAQRYFPPLHHHCKSFLVPNPKGSATAEREITGLKPSKSSYEKDITLAEHPVPA